MYILLTKSSSHFFLNLALSGAMMQNCCFPLLSRLWFRLPSHCRSYGFCSLFFLYYQRNLGCDSSNQSLASGQCLRLVHLGPVQKESTYFGVQYTQLQDVCNIVLL